MPNEEVDVNSFQVGGGHYKAAIQHWDFTERNGLRYLEGCATKYIARWRKKNGVNDLQKSLHYVQKLRALFIAGYIAPRRAPWFERLLDKLARNTPSLPPMVISALEFGKANDLNPAEIHLCHHIATWQNLDDLVETERDLKRLIKRVEGED